MFWLQEITRAKTGAAKPFMFPSLRKHTVQLFIFLVEVTVLSLCTEPMSGSKSLQSSSEQQHRESKKKGAELGPCCASGPSRYRCCCRCLAHAPASLSAFVLGLGWLHQLGCVQHPLIQCRKWCCLGVSLCNVQCGSGRGFNVGGAGVCLSLILYRAVQ